jgi:NADH dehydrogenase FAD-containing subunit
MSEKKTVILAGSGHAHLEVIKALTREEIAAHRFLLVSPFRDTYYSGLVPSFMMGDIEVARLTIRSADFSRAKGIEFLQDSVVDFSETENVVSFASGVSEKFDLLSLNVGGSPLTIPSESPSETIYLRPFDSFLPRWNELQRVWSSSVHSRFVVVGGGAAAVEVATALAVRLLRTQDSAGEVHLVAKGPKLCESYSDATSEAILRSLLSLKVHVHLNNDVQAIGHGRIELQNGKELDFEAIFLAIPTKPSSLTSRKIDSTLRISLRVFAVGDGTTMQDEPSLPRSGVIAVREGQHLVKNLRSLLRGEPPSDFIVPSNQLNILISGERSARAVWGAFSVEGRLPFRIKRWIDQRYVNSFVIS